MPARYEAIKRSLMKENPKMSYDEAQKHAAMIFNATRKKGEPGLSHKKGK